MEHYGKLLKLVRLLGPNTGTSEVFVTNSWNPRNINRVVNEGEYRVETSVLGDEQSVRFNESATVKQTMTLNQFYMAWNGRTTHMGNRSIGWSVMHTLWCQYVVSISGP